MPRPFPAPFSLSNRRGVGLPGLIANLGLFSLIGMMALALSKARITSLQGLRGKRAQEEMRKVVREYFSCSKTLGLNLNACSVPGPIRLLRADGQVLIDNGPNPTSFGRNYVAKAECTGGADIHIYYARTDLPPLTWKHLFDGVPIFCGSSELQLDPDGATGPLPIKYGLLAFDDAPNNILLAGALPSGVASGINTAAGTDFRLVSQSTVIPGFASSYVAYPGFHYLSLVDVTIHGSSTIGGTSAPFQPITFAPAAAAAVNRYEMRFHADTVALNGNTGAGFDTPSDPVMLAGRIVGVSGNLKATSLTPVSLLLPALQQTVSLTGWIQITVAIDSYNPSFFPSKNVVPRQISFYSLGCHAPQSVLLNSGIFWNGLAPNLGALNGSTGPDIECEGDNSFQIWASPA